jgi:hypothetical protein
MVANARTFTSPANKLRELPNYAGRKFVTRGPVCTLTRVCDQWSYCYTIDMGTVLQFTGWAGLDRDEPMAGFVSDDLPGMLILMPPSLLKKACSELVEAKLVQPVKVRIVDECGEGEGE